MARPRSDIQENHLILFLNFVAKIILIMEGDRLWSEMGYFSLPDVSKLSSSEKRCVKNLVVGRRGIAQIKFAGKCRYL